MRSGRKPDALAAQSRIMPAPVAVRYGDEAARNGTLAITASTEAPTAAGTGLTRVRVPASATITTAPPAWTYQAAPSMRLNMETEASITATAAASVSRWLIVL